MGSAPTELMGIGIDIAKNTFEVALGDGESFSLANDSGGQDALLARLQDVPIGLIVLEATGGYRRRTFRVALLSGSPV